MKPVELNDASLFPQRLTNVVPIFPIDSLEMAVSKIHWYTKGNGVTRICLEFDNGQRRTGILTTFPDLTDAHAASVAFLARHQVAQWADLPDRKAVSDAQQNIATSNDESLTRSARSPPKGNARKPLRKRSGAHSKYARSEHSKTPSSTRTSAGKSHTRSSSKSRNASSASSAATSNRTATTA